MKKEWPETCRSEISKQGRRNTMVSTQGEWSPYISPTIVKGHTKRYHSNLLLIFFQFLGTNDQWEKGPMKNRNRQGSVPMAIGRN